MPRKLEYRNTFVAEDIIKLIEENDISDPDTFFVLNGGTGGGKTHSIMEYVRPVIERKLGREQSILVVESRSLMVDQLNIQYQDRIETFNGIDVMQRIGFMHAIEHKRENHDWIVIDECHGLFSEAGFAEDAEYIASWIRSERPRNTHIIFITANDEYFEDLSRQYFPGKFNFIYLFPDFTKYVSHTYVKEIRFIKTSRTEQVLSTFISENKGKKILIFLKKASDVKDWYFKLLASGYNVGLIVSQANETTTTLTTTQQQIAQNAMLDISAGATGLTIGTLQELIDIVRRREGKEGIHEALANERLPEDIDILLATDTIQEGISIKSPINTIIIEGYTDVEVRQKLGRFRGNLDLLYIIFNPNTVRHRITEYQNTFAELQKLVAENNQVELAKFYGVQMSMKFKTHFLIEHYDAEGHPYYTINEPALLNLKKQEEQYKLLLSNTKGTVNEMYSYPLLPGSTPQILDYTQIRDDNTKEKLEGIVKVWRGVPLKGPAQELFVQDFIQMEVMDRSRHKVTTFIRACNLLREMGYEIKEKQAAKQDLANWPQYLSKPREKFKIIV